MKIKGTHSVCGRQFLAQQVLDSQGHCPWDGEPFNVDYTANLATALRAAEHAGSAFEHALEQVTDMHPNFWLDEESVLAEIRANLERLRERNAAVRR